MEIKVLRRKLYKPVRVGEEFNTTKHTETWREVVDFMNKPKSMRKPHEPRSIDKVFAYARGVNVMDLDMDNNKQDKRRLHVFACNIGGGVNVKFYSGGLKEFFNMVFTRIPPHRRNFYEVIKQNEPCNLYVDIDVPKLHCTAYIEPMTLMKDVNTFLVRMMKKTFDIQWDKIHTKSYPIESCGARKISYHIIIRVFRNCFKNTDELYAFIKYCWFEALRQEFVAAEKIWPHESKEEKESRDNRNKLPPHPLLRLKSDDPKLREDMIKLKKALGRESFFFLNDKGIAECAIDTAIYSHNRNFRVLWNTKPKHPDRVLKPFGPDGKVIPAPTWRTGRGGRKDGFFDSIHSVEACFKRHMVTYFPDSQSMSEKYMAFEFPDIAPSIRTMRMTDYTLSDDGKSLIYIRNNKKRKRINGNTVVSSHQNPLNENVSAKKKGELVLESALCKEFTSIFFTGTEMKTVVKDTYATEGTYQPLPPEIKAIIEKDLNDNVKQIDAFMRAEKLDKNMEPLLDIRLIKYFPYKETVTLVTSHTTCPFGDMEFKEGEKVSSQLFDDKKTGVKYYHHNSNHVYFVVNLLSGTYTLRCMDSNHYSLTGKRKNLKKDTKKQIFRWLREKKRK